MIRPSLRQLGRRSSISLAHPVRRPHRIAEAAPALPASCPERATTVRFCSAGCVTGAVNVPIQSFRRELPQLGLDGSKPVVAICKTAYVSRAATRMLRAHGFEAVQLAKGMDDWRRQKLPVHGV